MKRILFVDDEARILDGLRRSLRGVRGEWEMVFAEGGVAALRECAAQSFDVVVSDARMPGMEGAELLGDVRELYPDAARIILSGQCSRNSVLRCVGVAHQFLSKPCEPATLRSAVQKVCAIRDVFPPGPKREAISCAQWLPSQPAIRRELADAGRLAGSINRARGGDRGPRPGDVGQGRAACEFRLLRQPPTRFRRGARGQTSRHGDRQGDVGVRCGVSALLRGRPRRGPAPADRAQPCGRGGGRGDCGNADRRPRR